MIYIQIFVLLILSGFFSGSEIAFLSSDKLRLELDKSKGGISSRILSIFYRKPDYFITTLLLGNNVVLVVYGLVMARLVEPILAQWMSSDILILLCQSVIATLVILFTGEFIPKVVFRINSNQTLSFLAVPLFLVYIILYPFTYIIGLITKFFLRLAGQNTENTSLGSRLSMIDIEYYLENNQSQDEEGNSSTDVKIFQNAISFPSIQVRECMTPRNEIVGVEIDSPIEELEQSFIRTGLSKLIVYRESIDEVVGYIHSSEMFKGGRWQDRIVPGLFVPGSMYASKLMKLLMQKKRSLAIVIDELGGTAGMATLEDVVEEIFGDIEDEHDYQKRVAKQIDDRTFVLSGRLEIDDINERFGLNLPADEDFMTIAGFILHYHQRIPEQGEVLDIEGFRFEILRSSDSRIVLVKMIII